MGRKQGLMTSLFFKARDTSKSSTSSNFSSSPSYSWPWPSACKRPKTLSFREVGGEDVYKTMNSVYFDSTESCFTHTSEEESESFSTASEKDSGGGDSLERVIRGLQSDRLFFKPGYTSSIMEEAKAGAVLPFKESTAIAMESEDPYRDFRVSMEEMVVAHGIKDWECLEELLVWHLRANSKKTHGFIVGAFVDLLLGLASSDPPSSSSSSFMSFEIEEEVEEEGSRGSF